MTTHEALAIIVYAPSLPAHDKRALEIVQGMERSLPGLRLDWTVAEDGHLIALPQRDTWLLKGSKDGGFPLVCNGDESFPVTIFGLRMRPRQAPGGQPVLDVHAELPLTDLVFAASVDVLAFVAESARAFWGHATPFRAGVEIARQTRDPIHKPGAPPLGLPALKFAEKLRSPAIPHRLGWLNYWSAAAALAIGFPDPTRDAELLKRARRTETGSWVVQLTDAPLDLDNPAHLEVLKRTYERFPEIGGRASP
ncbi:hypothetical protein JGU66_01570 [Myxococcaceae bacterium JPH2]|nr:hypothetical protein [Myxococcaceae bacterium JPH2]